jgi:type I restriction enzyme, S subunit
MKKYPKMKSSGMEWIGEIPEKWKLTKLKYCLLPDGFKSGPFGSSLITDTLLDSGDVLVYTPEHIENNTIEFPQYIPKNREDELRNFFVKSGDIILPIVGTLGKGKLISKNDPPGIINQRLCRISADEKILDNNYALFLITKTQMSKIQITLNKKGAVLDHITKDIIYNTFFPIPSLEEQKQIGKFLNKKTTKIDSDIQKNKKLIKLLKEKKKSTIDQIVRKGLDATIHPKDSGINWIGDIPEHWTIIPCFSVIKEKTIKNMHDEIHLSVYRDFGVILRDSRDDNFNRISEDTSNYKLVENGDLVLNKMKCWAGSLGISKYRGVVSPAYRVYKIKNKFYLQYLHYLLRSTTYIQQYAKRSKGIRPDQWDLSNDDFKQLPILLPPINEQKQISEYIDKKLSHIDKLFPILEKQIKFLEEFKESLISLVVTGKIDVRGVIV